MLSGRGLCDELITRPEESYQLWCVVVCDLETSRIGTPYIYIYIYIYIYDISNLRVNGSGDNKIVSIGEVYEDSLTNNSKSDVPISTDILNMSQKFDSKWQSSSKLG